jgi:hypothetical protein
MINCGECPDTAINMESGCYSRTPVFMTGVMVALMKQYFGSSERIAIEKNTFLWNEDEGLNKVYIDDEFNWSLSKVGLRPAIIVALKDYSNLQDIPSVGRSGMIGYDSKTGSAVYGSIDTCGYDIQCIAKQKLECWSLAWEVKTLLQSYAYEIRKTYRFDHFRVEGIGKPTRLTQQEDHMVATVGVSYRIVETWGIQAEKLPLQSISLNIR